MVSERNAENTRHRLLQAAFEEMYLHGYQGLRIDSIIAKTQLAKGALYHHFPNKRALAYAIVDELITDIVMSRWARPLESSADPLTGMQELLRLYAQQFADNEAFQGCPLNNLAQEMAAIDEGFQTRLRRVMDVWISAFAEAFSRARLAGQLKAEVDPGTTAIYVISTVQGLLCTAKCLQSTADLPRLAEMLCSYIEGLRAP